MRGAIGAIQTQTNVAEMRIVAQADQPRCHFKSCKYVGIVECKYITCCGTAGCGKLCCSEHYIKDSFLLTQNHHEYSGETFDGI